MAWPTGVTLRTCSLGPDFGIVSGDDYGCDIVVSVSRPMMTWGATGSGGIGDQDSLSFTPGIEITFQLPVTDQVGWYIGGLPVDMSDGRQSHVYTLTIKPWIYNSLGRKTFSNATLTLANLAVPTGADTLDLDKSVATSGAQGGTVTIPDLLASLQASVDDYKTELETVAAAPTDAFVADRIVDPASQTTAALDAAIGAVGGGLFRPRPVTVDDVLAREHWTFGHRGAGLAIAPENTIEGFQYGVDAGVDIINPDAYLLLDGGVGIMHDTTTTETCLEALNVEALTSTAWKQLHLKPSQFGFPAWSDTHPPLFGEVLAAIGGRAVIGVEAKGTTPAKAAQVAAVVAAQAAAAGLSKSVMVQSFFWDACVAAVAGGIDAMWLDELTGGVPSKTPQQMKDAGVRFASCDWTYAGATDAISEWVAAGLIVAPFTVNYQSDADALFALGCAGIISDNPLYAARKYDRYRLTATPWDTSQTRYHGMLDNSTPGVFVGTAPNGRYQLGTSGTFQAGLLSPYADPGGSYAIAMPFTVDAIGTGVNTFFTGMYFCCTKDEKTAADTSDGYCAGLRANGQLQLWVRATGATTFTSKGTIQTPVLATGSTPTIIADVTPTTITLTRNDTPVATLSTGLASGTAVTSLPVNALANALASGNQVRLPTGQVATLNAAAAAGGTSLTVASITPSAAVAPGAALNGCIQINDSSVRGGYISLRDTGQNSSGRTVSVGKVTITPTA